jgi:putative acetyltransferase
MEIRLIQPQDNEQLKKIVQSVLASYGANKEGFAWGDPELNNMYEAYKGENKRYWVISSNRKIFGGGGIGILKNGEGGWCELQKMYFLKEARGKGLGKKILQLALNFAKNHYQYCYLETLNSMHEAQGLYKSFGFYEIEKPKGDTGHSGCDVWMEKKLID